MSKKAKILLIVAFVVLLSAIGVVTYLFLKTRSQNNEMQELFTIEKQELENEYSGFANQYQELQVQINNDSIQQKLEAEKLKTQRLLEELRQTKATDAAEITRLKKELATVRAVLKNYIMQIDSLNTANQQLTTENKKVKEQYNEATRQIGSLSQEKKQLSDKVTLASQLDAVNIFLSAQKKNGKEAKKLKDAVKLVLKFTLSKNISASTGDKTIYVRLTKPDGDLLTKAGSGTFRYENKALPFSIKKYIEYTGEEQAVTMYWDIEEYLSSGRYGVSIFIDGVMVGSGSYTFN